LKRIEDDLFFLVATMMRLRVLKREGHEFVELRPLGRRRLDLQEQRCQGSMALEHRFVATFFLL
jgi:hypothetical protein